MLFARLLSKIYKKKGIVLIDSQGQKYICGKPNLEKPLTLKLSKKNLNWKLVLNPDLNFPEAYIRGEIEFENEIYKRVLPPLSLLSEAQQKEMMSKLKALEFFPEKILRHKLCY